MCAVEKLNNQLGHMTSIIPTVKSDLEKKDVSEI